MKKPIMQTLYSLPIAGMSSDKSYSQYLAEYQANYQGKKGKHPLSPLDLPPDQRPRERLIRNGPSSLSDIELLSILINSGTRVKNVTELAKDLLDFLDKSKDIPPAQQLIKLSGMGKTKACAVSAMLEFGRRRWGALGCSIKHPSDIFILIRHNADRKQERFISLSLNGAHEVLAVRVVTIGLVNRTIVHPREVFADLIQDRAAAFVVAHNHPSGQLSPSPEDDEITDRLQKASGILGLHFLDHMIFSETAWWSYRQNGKMNNEKDHITAEAFSKF